MTSREDKPQETPIKESQWFSTEKITDGADSALKDLGHLDEALNTAPNRFTGLNDTSAKQ